MYKLILASRYLVKQRITYLAMGVVALSAFVVIVVMTVLQGLVGDFKQRTHDCVGDCVVGTDSLVGFPYYEEFSKVLEDAPLVEATSPVISSYGLVAMADSEKDRVVGLRVMGIDPIRHSRVTRFSKALHFHQDCVEKAFEPVHDPCLPGCIMGVDRVLDRNEHGQYDYRWAPTGVAYEITCFPLTAKGALAKAGAGEVSSKRFYFSDTAHTGLARDDEGVVYLSFEQLQQLCGMAGPIARTTAIHVKFRPGVNADGGTRQVARLWQDFMQGHGDRSQEDLRLLQLVSVKDWKAYRRATIAPMEKEELVMVVMFILVAVTTVFIVFVAFYMIVSHKSRDIGILKSVGASNAGTIGLFCGFAGLVGCIGGAVGLLGAWFFLLKINRLEGWLYEHFGFQLWDRTLLSIGDIPSQIQMELVVIVALCAVGVSLLGALVPILQVARTRPVETLQVSQL